MKRILTFLIAITMIVSGCAKTPTADVGEEARLSEHLELTCDELDLAYSPRDLSQDFNKDAAVRITLNGERATIKGKGAVLTKDEGGAYLVTPAKNQSSGLFGPIQRSNCFIVLPEGPAHEYQAGDTMDCVLLDIPEEVVL